MDKITNLEYLISDKDSHIGTLVSMGYDSAVLASNDALIYGAGGIPRRAFLLASPIDVVGELEQLVLLAVDDVAQLDLLRQFNHVREDLALKGRNPSDVNTKNRLQQVAFSCKIIGTFYFNEEGVVQFGSDLDRVFGNAIYKVFKPSGKALSLIASHSNENHDPKGALPIGLVRYSDTRKLIDEDAKVFVNIEDFLGSKTFFGGITRTGKSNTLKVILQKIFQYTHRVGGSPVGQLIFDPQGEYANTNSQDGSALADIGSDDEIRIYKILGETKTSEKEQHLQFNLLNDENMQLSWELMLLELRAGVSGSSNYIQPLYDIDFTKPDETASNPVIGAFGRKKLAYYALLHKIKWSEQFAEFPLWVGKNVAREAVADIEEVYVDTKEDRVLINSTRGAYDLFLWLKMHESRLPEWWQKDYQDGALSVFIKQFEEMDEGKNGLVGAFWRIKSLHNKTAEGDVRKKVWRDMQKGRLVVIDLSKGSSRISSILSELIVKHLISESSARFTQNMPSVPYQIVVEEAHNLFDVSKGDDDPWVRISKEAAKYDIGLMYATQEVSSVDPRILSNTVNWLMGGFNSRYEVKELGKYYSFRDWAEHLVKVETKGFIRMKTKTSPFIIPVQIEKFVADKRIGRLASVDEHPTESGDMPQIEDISDFF